jgi:hypothetical protein
MKEGPTLVDQQQFHQIFIQIRTGNITQIQSPDSQ